MKVVFLAPDGNELVLPGASTYSLYGFCLECDLSDETCLGKRYGSPD